MLGVAVGVVSLDSTKTENLKKSLARAIEANKLDVTKLKILEEKPPGSLLANWIQTAKERLEVKLWELCPGGDWETPGDDWRRLPSLSESLSRMCRELEKRKRELTGQNI